MSRFVIYLTALAFALTVSAMSHAESFEDGVLAFDQKRYGDAKELFESLVESGHAGAESMLGVMYFNGQGVVQDRYIAAIYFYKSARRGNANAQLALGSLYIEGIGVRANVATAYKWISLAEGATTGVLAEAARQLKERLDGRLSNEERLAAEAKIAESKPVRSNN